MLSPVGVSTEVGLRQCVYSSSDAGRLRCAVPGLRIRTTRRFVAAAVATKPNRGSSILHTKDNGSRGQGGEIQNKLRKGRHFYNGSEEEGERHNCH